MAFSDLFGFKIVRASDKEDKNIPTFSAEVTDDGSYPLASMAGFYGTSVDVEGLTRNETELVRRYREISLYPEVDQGIQDIVNEAICEDSNGDIVKLDLEHVNLDDRIKTFVEKEFYNVLNLLDFREASSELFRRWYVDGKIYYHIIVDSKNIQSGIKDLRLIDSIKMKKIVEYETSVSSTGTPLLHKGDEYFIYSDNGFGGAGANSQLTGTSPDSKGVKISVDSILYCNSGMVDPSTQNVLGHLHKAIRSANQLKMMEDAIVIYRLSRASERRVFKIPVGHLPKAQQEAYMQRTIGQYRNKMVYDGKSGEVRDDKKFMSMQEDMWFPVYGDGKSADVTTLPGAQALDKIEDVIYFKTKLYQALNIPPSRLQEDKSFTLGRSSEITRDEVKFTKFIDKLRRRFSGLILDALKIQCILKGIMTIEEWEDAVQDVKVLFTKDNSFTELKEVELLNERLDTLGKIDGYIGTYFSRNYVYRQVLGMTESESQEMEDQIEKERVFNADEYKPVPTGSGGMGDLGGGGFGGGGGEFDFGDASDVEFGSEPTDSSEPETSEPSPSGEVTFAPPSGV